MKKRFRQIQFRKNFISWVNALTIRQVISDECFESFKKNYGLNCIFEAESKGLGMRKYVVLTVTALPSPKLFKSIKNSDAMVLHRIRHYTKDGFSKTYCY